MKCENNISNSMWHLRAIAIISVVCAHCNVEFNLNQTAIAWEAHILSNIGTVGVGLFFFSSGFFYKKFEISQLKRKALYEFMPWVIAATIVWLYVVLRKGNIGVAEWIGFVLGYNSIYYFMADLVAIKLIFNILDRKIQNPFVIHFLCLALNVVSIWTILIGKDVAPTPYLNPLIFISYFSLGHLFSIYQWKGKIQYILPTLACGLIVLLSKHNLTYYMGIEEILIETMLICSIWMTLNKQKYAYKRIIALGKKSYAIYLWHIPFAGIISNLCNRNVALKYFSFLWPLIIIFITLIFFRILKKVFCFFRLDNLLFITGVRS